MNPKAGWDTIQQERMIWISMNIGGYICGFASRNTPDVLGRFEYRRIRFEIASNKLNLNAASISDGSQKKRMEE